MPNVTIYTLAKELGMTTSMVSRAFNPDAKINEEKRKIVLETAKKYDFSPNKFASRLSRKTVRIGILINSRFSVNTEKMLEGIEEAYQNLKDYKIKYDVKIMNSMVNTVDEYKAYVKKLYSYDGVIISGMSSAKYTDILKELYENNPNIVQVQAINEDVPYLFSSKHDEKTASYLSAEFLSRCLFKSERKNILLFTGDRESYLHKEAEKLFKKALDENGLNLLDSIDMKDDVGYFEKIIPEVYSKYLNQIDGIYITSGFSYPLSSYLEKNNIKIPYVTFDTYDEIKKYMEKGVISATISQNVRGQMASAFEILCKYLITDGAVKKTVYTDVQLVLKSNIHQFN